MTYTIEPPEDRRHGLSVMRKLDTIIDMLTPGGDDEESAGDEVTFEPEIDQLPTTPELEGEGEDDNAAQGEGTANVAEGHRPRFHFPGRHYRSPDL